MRTTVPRDGSGYFQWNTGAWFGSVIGGTSWMMVAAGFLLVYQELGLAAIAIGGFALNNVVALSVWRRRSRLDPFRALIGVLCLMAVTLPSVWFAISEWASPQALEKMNWPSSRSYGIVAAFLVPVCMAWFYMFERRAKGAQSRRCTTG